MTSYMLRMIRREQVRQRRRDGARAKITRGSHPDVTTVDVDVPVKVRPSHRATTEVTHGGEQVALHLYDVGMDFDQDIARDDVITITRSADPLLEGRWITVIEVTNDEWQADRIVICKESR